MQIVRIPEQKLQWLRYQDYTRRVTKERESIAAQAIKHYTEPASRQFQLIEQAKEEAEYQTMVSRLEHLTRMELDDPITHNAVESARKIIADIITFMMSNTNLTAPNIFSTNNGRVSFEWQPHKTGGDIIGSILLAVDGMTADFQIERYSGTEIEVLLSEDQSALTNMQSFLSRLVEAVSVSNSMKRAVIAGL